MYKSNNQIRNPRRDCSWVKHSTHEILRTHMNKKWTLGKPKSNKWCFSRTLKACSLSIQLFLIFVTDAFLSTHVQQRVRTCINDIRNVLLYKCTPRNLSFPLSLQGQQGNKEVGVLVAVFKEELNTIMNLHGANNSIMNNYGSHLFYNSC